MFVQRISELQTCRTIVFKAVYCCSALVKSPKFLVWHAINIIKNIIKSDWCTCFFVLRELKYEEVQGDRKQCHMAGDGSKAEPVRVQTWDACSVLPLAQMKCEKKNRISHIVFLKSPIQPRLSGSVPFSDQVFSIGRFYTTEEEFTVKLLPGERVTWNHNALLGTWVLIMIHG